MKVMSTINTNQVHETKDYDKFKILKGNRSINQRNYTKIVASVKEKQLQIPILVNEKMEIIDGQHRFRAWKELNMPIYYIVVKGYGIEEVKRANAVGAVWTKADFMNTYVEEGNRNYIEFYTLHRIHKVSVADLLSLYAFYQKKNGSQIQREFQLGNFICDYHFDVALFLEALEVFKEFDFSKTKNFVQAFFKLYTHPKYDADKMTKQYNANYRKFGKRSTMADYLVMLTKDIYSFNTTKNTIFFDKVTRKFY